MTDPRTERDRLRAERRAVPAATARAAATSAAALGVEWIDERRPQGRVAGYVATDGELDPAPLLDALRERGHRTYLPVCVEDRLRFGPWDGRAPLAEGRWGIPEPTGADLVDAAVLDVVLVPLVAFDDAGHRLGRGAGFYDRTFGATPPSGARPLLVGLAHDLQELPRWEPESWDVPLDAVVTPTRLLIPSV